MKRELKAAKTPSYKSLIWLVSMKRELKDSPLPVILDPQHIILVSMKRELKAIDARQAQGGARRSINEKRIERQCALENGLNMGRSRINEKRIESISRPSAPYQRMISSYQ